MLSYLVGPQAFSCGFFNAGVDSLSQLDAGNGCLAERFVGADVLAGAGAGCVVTKYMEKG